MLQFKPTRNTLLVSGVRELPLYETDLEIPEEHRERWEPVQYGLVEAVGEGILDIAPGDTVFFAKYSGIPYGDYRFIHQDCITFKGEED